MNKRILAALIFVLAGCGRGDGTPPTGLDPSVLAGTWALPCENYGNGWVIEELAFSGNSMRRTVSNFEDSGCTTATRYVSVDHDFLIPASSEIVVGAYDVNLTVVASEALIFDEEIAADFSAAGRCDIDNWPTGDAVDLSNAPAGCYEGDFPPLVGAASYTIMKPQNGELAIGQNSSFNDGKTPETRHINLSELVYSR